jgi:UDP-2,4-diacetamido-2,4,6-trideoxy-beta-L-altropyranose hydrolase
MTLILRAATEADARRLFDWRNDPLTRNNSLETGQVSWEEHRRWLAAALARPDRRLLVAEYDGEVVGTVRLDQHTEGCELSWTVAPAQRGRGVGKAIVAAAVALAGPGALIARIKRGNAASLRIAEACGFVAAGSEGDVLIYRRAPAQG